MKVVFQHINVKFTRLRKKFPEFYFLKAGQKLMVSSLFKIKLIFFRTTLFNFYKKRLKLII